MSKYSAGDYIQIKAIDELLETYQGKGSKCEAIRKRTYFRSSSGLLFTESMFSLCGKAYKSTDNDYFNGNIMIYIDDERKYYLISSEWISDKDVEFSIDKEKVLLLI